MLGDEGSEDCLRASPPDPGTAVGCTSCLASSSKTQENVIDILAFDSAIGQWDVSMNNWAGVVSCGNSTRYRYYVYSLGVP